LLGSSLLLKPELLNARSLLGFSSWMSQLVACDAVATAFGSLKRGSIFATGSFSKRTPFAAVYISNL
jgi:hypothetical protein